MLEDAADTCSGVPSLTGQNCISLGSIAGHQRKKALGIPPKRKEPSGIAKDCLAGIYLMPEDEERYKTYTESKYNDTKKGTAPLVKVPNRSRKVPHRLAETYRTAKIV